MSAVHWLSDNGCPGLAGELDGARMEYLATEVPERVTCEHCDLSISVEQARERNEAIGRLLTGLGLER